MTSPRSLIKFPGPKPVATVSVTDKLNNGQVWMNLDSNQLDEWAEVEPVPGAEADVRQKEE